MLSGVYSAPTPIVHPSQEEFCRLWGRLTERAWVDDEFRSRLTADPAGVLREHGYELPPGANVRLEVVASDEDTHYLYVPCAGELRADDGQEAGDVAADCPNNRLALSHLAAKTASRSNL